MNSHLAPRLSKRAGRCQGLQRRTDLQDHGRKIARGLKKSAASVQNRRGRESILKTWQGNKELDDPC